VVLVVGAGALSAPGKRTVSAILRVMGLNPNYQNYHRVLNRAVWSSRIRKLHSLTSSEARCLPLVPLVMGIDDTIERRRENRLPPEVFIVTQCVQ